MKKLIFTISLLLAVQFAFSQTEPKRTEEYCMVVYDYRYAGKMVQEIGLVKPDGKIEISPIQTNSSPYMEIIKLLNKLNSEGWEVVNSQNIDFNKGGSTTANSILYLLKRTL